MKLQIKLLLVVVPLIVIPLLVLGWLAYAQLRDITLERTDREMVATLDQMVRQFEEIRRNAQGNLALFSHSVILQRYIRSDDPEERYALLQPTLLELFRGYQQAYPDYHEIRLLTPDGYEDTRAALSDTNRTPSEAGTSLFSALQALGDSTVHSTVLIHPDSHRPALVLGRKLHIKDPRVDPAVAPALLRGYLLLTVDLEFMARQVDRYRLGERGRLFYLDQSGRILFHPRPARRGEQLPVALTRQLLAAADGAALRAMYQRQPHRFRIRRLSPELYLLAALPEEELFAATGRLHNQVAALTLGAILLTALLLLAVLKVLLVNPIQRLSLATRQIAQGQLDGIRTPEGGDEIGQLGRSFNEMADSLHRSNQQVSFLAYYDPVTGLPNRVLFKDRLRQALGQSRRDDRPLALLFLDLDDFKRINDTWGHHLGDRLLREAAGRLESCLRRTDAVSRPEGDLVARLGGDEFLILLSDLHRPEDATRVAERILDTLNRPFRLDDHPCRISCSLGITVAPDDGLDPDLLIKNADMAMYHAKERGKNNHQFYNESMNRVLVERLDLEARLRQALERGELALHYQPQVDIIRNRVVGVEALLRWHNPQSGWISPAVFIPLAEDSGLIVPISAWVLEQAAYQARHWHRQGLDLKVSVNISGTHMNRGGVAEMVGRVLADTGLDPALLDLELTETSVMTAQEDAARVLADIKALGVNISLDDFGTGYSSLSYLRRFPIDTLKIDRSFLRNLPGDGDDAAIVTAIIAMAHSLKLKVVAEGVETEPQLAFLRRQHCDRIQGFLLGRPMPAEDLETWLSEPLSPRQNLVGI